jgi:preprotein translocase subunit Sec63
MRDADPLLRWQENPFYLLGIDASASALEAERQGRKLLAQLELDLAAARVARTPVGPVERTVESVRKALSELRDPKKREQHALWARLPAAAPVQPTGVALIWPDAMRAIGWPGI